MLQVQWQGWPSKGLALPFLPRQLEPATDHCLLIARHANSLAFSFKFLGFFEADELAAFHLAGVRACSAGDSFIVHDAIQNAGSADSAECRLLFQRLSKTCKVCSAYPLISLIYYLIFFYKVTLPCTALHHFQRGNAKKKTVQGCFKCSLTMHFTVQSR